MRKIHVIALTACLLCLLTSLSLSSQTRYPRSYTSDGDTLIVITFPQLRTVNAIFQSAAVLKTENGYLREMISSQDSLLTLNASSIMLLRESNDNLSGQIAVLEEMKRNSDMLSDNAKKALKRRCWIVGGCCVCVGIGVGCLICALK